MCGRDFNPRGFQVVVPGLGRGFDRIECAVEASESGLAPAAGTAEVDTALMAAPVTASATPRAPAALGPAVATSAGIVRAPLLSSGNLVLLAALTAGTIFLWLRVFAPGDLSISLPGGSAAPSFERGTVPAVIASTPAGPLSRPVADGAVRADGLPAPTAALTPDKTTRDHKQGGASDDSGSGKPSGGGSEPSGRPASTPLTPPVQPTPPRTAPTPTQPSPLPSPGDAHPSSGGGSGGGHEAPSLPTQPSLPTLP
jgi:hypothetical protein